MVSRAKCGLSLQLSSGTAEKEMRVGAVGDGCEDANTAGVMSNGLYSYSQLLFESPCLFTFVSLVPGTERRLDKYLLNIYRRVLNTYRRE